MNTFYLSIGSNTNPYDNLKHIVALLRQRARVTAVSAIYESYDVNDTDQTYLNAAVIIETPLDAEALKESHLTNIEDRLERQSSGVFVTADIDIVLVNNQIMTYLGRSIPDPGILKHPFITRPLADIAPNYIHPQTQQTLAEIAASLPNVAITRRDDLTL